VPIPGPPSGPGLGTTTDRARAHRTQNIRPGLPRLVLAGVLAAVAGIGVVLGVRFLGPGHAGATPGSGRHPSAAGATSSPASSPPPRDAFGVPTVTRECPAASVPGAGARCTAQPECWNGLVSIAGNVTIAPLPCRGAYYYQTFAIGLMPASLHTWDQDTVQADPTVMAVCSKAVLLRSRTGPGLRIGPRRWEVDVVPPDETEYDKGARYYRCLGRLAAGGYFHAPVFGP
jgi:hypothetical protein